MGVMAMGGVWGSVVVLWVSGGNRNDVGEWWQVGFQDTSSAVAEEIVLFHDEIMFVLLVIVVLVVWLIWRALWNMRYNGYLGDGVLIEIIWTILPAAVLVCIALPSLRLLYVLEEVVDAGITVKVVGHQWYWSYEYSDYGVGNINYDSYMVEGSELSMGELRLLEVDNRLVVPVGTEIRLLVTGGDVIHSFAVPSLGVKVDGIPGRLNQCSIMLRRPGVYYGQCSEICGANHSFMPIVVEGVSVRDYIGWVDGMAGR